MLKRNFNQALIILFMTITLVACSSEIISYTPNILEGNEIELSNYEVGTKIDLEEPTSVGKEFYAWQAISDTSNNNSYKAGIYDISDYASSDKIDSADTRLVATWKTTVDDSDIESIITAEVERLGNNADLNHILTESVTDMESLFTGKNLGNFNGDISNWDVSSVTNMNSMFAGNTFFNQDLSSWDVSSVTNMSFMFNGSSSFNQNLSSWDVSKVEFIDEMFNDATSFEKDLSAWSLVSLGTSYTDLTARQEVFNGSAISNLEVFKPDMLKEDAIYSPVMNDEQKLELGYPVGSNIILPTPELRGDVFVAWQAKSSDHINYTYEPGEYEISTEDNANVISVNYSELVATWEMYPDDDIVGESLLNYVSTETTDERLGQRANLNHINTTGIVNMDSLFMELDEFNGDISEWDVSSVTNMSNMFSKSTAFNGDISEWDVSSVTNMSNMFSENTAFNGDISEWNVSNVTTMDNMFKGSTNFNQGLSSWTPNKVTTLDNMFNGATDFDQNLSSSWTLDSLSDGYETDEDKKENVFVGSAMANKENQKPSKLQLSTP
jgi:surface protein